jgi:hypothetical protein
MKYTSHGTLQSRNSSSLRKVNCVDTDFQEEDAAIDYDSQPLSFWELTEICV